MDIKLTSDKYIRIDKFPKICSICHHAIAPKHYLSVLVVSNKLADLVFQCTNCNSVIIGKYTYVGSDSYYLKTVLPIVPEKVSFEEEIERISPIFVEIYNQAIQAESKSLDQLTGIGLRKSLEFLIKDFLTSQTPENEETIKSSTLSQCINNFIQDNNLKEVAKLATWLGNDETHYVRKWEDKDIKDLKRLIKLTVNWIHNIILTDEYIDDMNS